MPKIFIRYLSVIIAFLPEIKSVPQYFLAKIAKPVYSSVSAMPWTLHFTDTASVPDGPPDVNPQKLLPYLHLFVPCHFTPRSSLLSHESLSKAHAFAAEVGTYLGLQLHTNESSVSSQTVVVRSQSCVPSAHSSIASTVSRVQLPSRPSPVNPSIHSHS